MLMETDPVKRKQECIEKNICDIPLLKDWTHNNITDAYHSTVENSIITQINEAFGCVSGYLSTGNAPKGDVILLDGTLVEIKIRSFNGSFFLETGELTTPKEAAIRHKKPKGIALTESKYYIILQPGMLGDAKVLKVRVVPTHWLKEYCNTTMETTLGNSVGVDINWSDIEFDDGWIGRFPYNEEEKTFNLGAFKAVKNIHNVYRRHQEFKKYWEK